MRAKVNIFHRLTALALTLAIAMSLCGGIPGIRVNATGESSNFIVEESFEIGESFEANENTGIKSTSSKVTVDGVAGDNKVTWNGAAPKSGVPLSTYLGDGIVTLSIVSSGAYKGNNCIEHTANGYEKSGKTVYASRCYPIYTLTSAQTAQMTDGETYTASVWVKQGQENAGKVTLEVNNGEKYTNAQSATSLEWQQLKVNFAYNAEKTVKLQVTIANPSGSDVTSVYVDYLTVAKLEKAEDSVSIPETATVEVGKTVTLTATVPEGLTAGWASSDHDVATVDSNGVVTGVKAGTATITATVGKATDTCLVTVTEQSPYIVYESFENPVSNSNSDVWMEKSGAATWNGASHANWNVWVNTPTLMVDGICTDAYDGNNAVKVTPKADATGGRGTMLYKLTDAEMERLEAGGEYTIKVYVKADATLTNFGFEVKNVADSTLLVGSLGVGTTWKELSYTFTLAKKDKNVEIGIGPKGAVTAAYYIDKVTLEPTDKATAISLSESEFYLELTKTKELSYTLTPVSARTDVEFSSSDVAVATVDNSGKVTAVSAGDAVITAVALNGRVNATCTVHVVDKYVGLTGISLNKTQLALAPGGEEKLEVTYTPADATVKNAAWTSTNEQVAVVDADGNVTAIGVGTAEVKATSGVFSANCTVTVTENAGFASKTESVSSGFAQKTEIDLASILAGESYKVISAPSKGSIYISNGKAYYTSYTWLMENDGEFVDQEYTDKVTVSVKNSSGDTATITLNITIGKLYDLFWSDDITSMDLLFSQEYLDGIKSAAKTDTVRGRLFKQVLDYADKNINVSTPEPITSKVFSYNEEQRSVGDYAVLFTMAYLLTKDNADYATQNQSYLNAAIRMLKASLSYPFWGTFDAQNSDLPSGHQLFASAMAYHWLQDELSSVTCTHTLGTDYNSWTIKETKDMPILDALEERMWQAGGDLYKYSANYKVYVMNHSNIRMGGLMAAAVALRPAATTQEEKQTLVNWMGMGLFKDGYGMNALMPDGTSQEGLPYWEYGTAWVIRGAYVAESALGIDLIQMTGVYKNSADYILYYGLPMNEWTATQNLLNVGDSPTYHYDGPTHILRVIAAEYQDQTAQWLAAVYENKGLGIDRHCWISLMFADTTVAESEPEDLETLKWYKDLDHVISRSDWSGNEDILSMKTGVPCGKNLLEMVRNGSYVGEADAGHAHPDANHITLYSNGEYLIRDDGYSDKYASNHNTLLVNGKGQLGEAETWMQEQPYIDNNAVPHIDKAVEVNEDGVRYDYIVGDATEAYAASLGLQKFQRNVVYLKDEKVLLVVDNIQAVSNTELELRWYTTSKSALLSAGVYSISSSANNLNFFPFTDSATTTTTFEEVTLYGRAGATSTEKTFRQVYAGTGTKWQNAVAFSWNEAGKDAAYVTYKVGENANEHYFRVGEKTYIINVENQTVTLSDETFESTSGGAADDSSVSTLLINGTVYDAFDSAKTEYTIDRWWKDYDLTIQAATTAYGAKVTVNKTNSGVEIVCVSRDGSKSTTYKITITNTQKLLGIKSGWTNVYQEDCDISNSWDGFVAITTEPTYWVVRAPGEGETDAGKVYAQYDLGEVVTLQKLDIVFHNSMLRDTYYDLNVSVDGTNWTSLRKDATCYKADSTCPYSSGNHGWTTLFENEPYQVRYVQFIMRGNSQNTWDKPGCWNGIMEISFYGLPAGEIEAGDTGYTAGLKTDSNEVSVGDTVNVSVQVASKEYENFASSEVKLSYDADKLTFDKERSTLNGAIVKDENGVLTLEDYGETQNLGTAYVFAFTAKAKGDATLALTSAAFSTQMNATKNDLIPATLASATATVKITLRHDVTLPEIFEGADNVADGTEYTFKAKDSSHYDYGEVTATINGKTAEVINNGDGTYTVKNVTGELVITGTRAPKSYDITFSGNGAADLTDAAAKATYGTDYTFTVPTAEGYIYYVTIKYANGNTVPCTSSAGVITIAGNNVISNITIIVTKTTVGEEQAVVVVEGNAKSDVVLSYEGIATPGTDYSFTINKDAMYNYEVIAKNGAITLVVTEGENNTYSISGKDFKAGDTIVITVIKSIKTDGVVEVKDYLTLDETKMWLILVKSDEVKDGGYTYNGNMMFWSDKYEAYCYLVIAAEKPTVSAGNLAISSETATAVNYGMDVNMSGKVDANDAQLVYNMYNAHYSDFTNDVTVEKFLRADVNGDCKVDVTDSAAIINAILNPVTN